MCLVGRKALLNQSIIVHYIKTTLEQSYNMDYIPCDCNSVSLYPALTAKPDHEQLIVDRENFDSYDTNGDGRLDRSELRAWILPDHRSIADEEAEHLLSETDMNRDNVLTFDEILDRHDLWVGSAATAYGEELRHHDPAEL